MIIPMVCFSCGKPIAHLWLIYLEMVKSFEIERNSAIISISEKIQDEDERQKVIESLPTPEFLALMRLKIFRQCCRRMFLCQHDMYEKIK